MALTAAQQRAAWHLAAEVAPALTTLLTKPDLDAAAANIDAWMDANQAGFVAQLPEPFKSNSNATQKALLFAYIMLKRYSG